MIKILLYHEIATIHIILHKIMPTIYLFHINIYNNYCMFMYLVDLKFSNSVTMH